MPNAPYKHHASYLQDTAQYKQLVWHCRRGVKELDVLFEQFLNTHYVKLTEIQRKALAELLKQQDPIIMDWLLERTQPEQAALKEIVDLLKASML